MGTDGVARLAEAIKALRAELRQAMLDGQNEDFQFRLRPIELTLEAVVTKGADGRIGWSVLGVGAKAEAATTQTLKLQLEPLFRTADGELTADFAVADQADQDQHIGPGSR